MPQYILREFKVTDARVSTRGLQVLNAVIVRSVHTVLPDKATIFQPKIHLKTATSHRSPP